MTLPRCPRRTCTCTSPARCGRPRCSTSPRGTASICRTPSPPASRPSSGRPTRRAGSGSSGCTTSPGPACGTSPTCAGSCSEAAEDDARDGSRWLELQVDPTSYAVHLGGLTPTLELIQDAARNASAATGVGISLIVAASRMRHPLDARTLARLAVHHAGDGPGGVIGFGLSNDERRGDTSEFAGAFRIARRAGLLSVPHSGELLGPEHVRTTLDSLAPDRIGHGVRSVEDRDGAGRRGRPGHHAGGLPGQQCGARGLSRSPARCRCAALLRGRGSGRARAPTTRCCSARGWPTSTGSRARTTAAPTPSSRRPGPQLVGRLAARPTPSRRQALADIDAWLAGAPELTLLRG